MFEIIDREEEVGTIIKAVSYTHLDVYKRQVQDGDVVLTMGAGSIGGISAKLVEAK